MKYLAIASLLLILFIPIAKAQVQYYGIEAFIDEKGKSFVSLTITFSRPVKTFSFNVFGRIENFNASSIAGPVSCSLEVREASKVDCKLALTEEKRTLEIKFETKDFVKALDNKFFFNADLSLNRDVKEVFAYVKLAEGLALVEEDGKKLIIPENATILSDGRRIIVNWKLSDVKSSQPIRFQILYEKIRVTQFFQVWHFVLIVAIFTIALFFVLRYLRKPEKLILSVLDEYERKVFDVIVASGGVVNQKKIVRDTNLSKAKVSRVVKSLVERGLISVERRGRTNMIKLTKRKFI